MLTTADIHAELKRLVVVFPSNRRDLSALAEIYKTALQGIDPTALHAAADRCIQEDQFFPKVARLREAASDYARRHPSRFAPLHSESWDTCGVCGAKAIETATGRTAMNHDARLHHVRYEEGAA